MRSIFRKRLMVRVQGAAYPYPVVNTYADLPASPNLGDTYFVATETGSYILFNKKLRGLYRWNGSSWDYAGDLMVTADEVGYTASVGSDWGGTTAWFVNTALDYIGAKRVYSVDYLLFNTNPTIVGHTEGRLYYDYADKTLALNTDVTGVTLQIGQENFVKVINKTLNTIVNGSIVIVYGATSGRPKIELADATSEALSEGILGVVTANILKNAEGYVTTQGLVRGLNTIHLDEGDVLYLDPTTPGGFTKTKPSAPNHSIKIGTVVTKDNTNGIILVHVDSGYEIGELHDVKISTFLSKQSLVYNTLGYLENAYISHGDTTSRDIAGNHALLVPSSDSTTALKITKANGTTAILTSDSTNNYIYIGSSGISAELRINGNTSGYVGLLAPLVAGNTTYTLPSADGVGGYVLSTNGSGILSWIAQPTVITTHNGLSSRDVAGNHAKLIPSADSTTAIQITKNDGSTVVLNADTSNNRIGIGISTPTNKLHIDYGTGIATYSQYTNGTTTGQLSSDGLLIGIDATGKGIINQQEALGFTLTVNSNTAIDVTSAGLVGIGKAAATYTLNTNTIGSTGIVLSTSGLPFQVLQTSASAPGTYSRVAQFRRYLNGTGALANGDGMYVQYDLETATSATYIDSMYDKVFWNDATAATATATATRSVVTNTIMYDRDIICGKQYALTDAITSLFNCSIADGGFVNLTVVYGIFCSDGTDHQSISGQLLITGTRKGAVITTQINRSEIVNEPTGTLVNTFSIVNDVANNQFIVKTTCVSSLTQTVHHLTLRIFNNSTTTITLL